MGPESALHQHPRGSLEAQVRPALAKLWEGSEQGRGGARVAVPALSGASAAKE